MMDVFEAHKYLDPTTLNDSSFLSFSSFADLTKSPYDDYLAPTSSCSTTRAQVNHHLQPHHQFIQPNRLQPQPFGLYQSLELPSSQYSTPTPPASYHFDSGSESPSTPYHFTSSDPSYHARSPATNDFGIFHSPLSSPLINRGGPSRYSAPTTTPSHHVSHRSTSSSSDWNSPVTPSLTYKSSVDSLASFAPEPDFFLPPSSTHTAFGWDDQSLGSSSSLTLQSPKSPSSPSPHRVASNPTLGINRHPRSIPQVKSLPSLREEGTASMDPTHIDEDAEALFKLYHELDLQSARSQTWQSFRQPSDTTGTMFEQLSSFGVESPDFPSTSDASQSGGESSSNGTAFSTGRTTSIDQFPHIESIPNAESFIVTSSESMVAAPSLVPDLSTTSNATTISDAEMNAWVNILNQAVNQAEVDQSNIQSGLEGKGNDTASGQWSSDLLPELACRPVTAPEIPTVSSQASASFDTALGSRVMNRSQSSNALKHLKSTDESYSYNPQQHVLSDRVVQYALLPDQLSFDPAALGMTSVPPAELPCPSTMMTSRRVSHPLNRDESSAQYVMCQQPNVYNAPPMQAPTLRAEDGWHSIPPPPLRADSASLRRVSSHNGTSYPFQEQEQQNPPRRLSIEEASVMQPYVPQPFPPTPPGYVPSNRANQDRVLSQQYNQQVLQMQQQVPIRAPSQQFMGWAPPAATTPATYHQPQFQGNNSVGSGSVTTHAYAPLVNVHPPATSFHPNTNPNSCMPSASAPVLHRVHPPPHPGYVASGSAGPSQQQRPMARMPSGGPGSRQSRKVTGTAKAKPPKSPGRKKNMPVAGIQEHGGTFFANYTPNDSQTLLKGVAPSGSQSKRKREENAALLSIPMGQVLSGSSISGDEDSRSKRSRSNDSSSQPQ